MASGSASRLGFATMFASTEGAISSVFFGWDLLYKTIERVVHKKTDVLIALAHFILVNHYQMRCIGVGDHKTITENDTDSALLPDGWNKEDKSYSLRYIRNGKLYLLLGDTGEDFVTINLLDMKESKVANLTLNPESVVMRMRGSLLQMIPNITSVFSQYRQKLVDPVFTQAIDVQQLTHQLNPWYQEEFGNPRLSSGAWLVDRPLPFQFTDVGSGDLDPLGRGGPGNLFPTPTHPNFEVINPRTNPYGPERHTRSEDPDPDHLQTPDCNRGSYM